MKVGEVAVQIPVPDGFVRYDGQPGDADQIASALMPGANRVLAAPDVSKRFGRRGFPQLSGWCCPP